MTSYRICELEKTGIFKVQYKAWWTLRRWRDYRVMDKMCGISGVPLTIIARFPSYKDAFEFVKEKREVGRKKSISDWICQGEV